MSLILVQVESEVCTLVARCHAPPKLANELAIKLGFIWSYPQEKKPQPSIFLRYRRDRVALIRITTEL